MKYPSIPQSAVKTINIDCLDGGLNTAVPQEQINDNQITECSNVWTSNGALRTRPGIVADGNSIIRRGSEIYDETCDFKISDEKFNIDGEDCRILTIGACYSDSQYDAHIYFVGESGKTTSTGYIHFNRVTSEQFFCPESIVYFSGAPINGGGIFALITVRDIEGTGARDYYIYEINSSMYGWERNLNFYIPTIYINGRGTRFKELNSEQVYGDNPKYLESPNLLTGGFKAYYSSDGISSCFKLPRNKLKGNVRCRIYYNLSSYTEWFIYEGSASTTQTFFSAEVTMTVDREKGFVNFTSNSQDYPISIMTLYRENNIVFTAYVENADYPKKIISSKSVAFDDSHIFLGGGIGSNEVFVSEFSNPLYFPQKSAVTVGDTTGPITGLAHYKGKIVAFKKNEIYSISATKQGAFSDYVLLADNDKIFHKPDTVKATAISRVIGCTYPKTIQVCGNNIVWLGSDRHVYTMSGISSANIYNISAPIDKLLAAEWKIWFSIAFSFIYGEYYGLMVNGKSYIMNFAVNDFRYSSAAWEKSNQNSERQWYIWKFSNKIQYKGAVSGLGSTYFICFGNDWNTCYKGVLSESVCSDTDVTKSGDTVSINEYAFSSHFTTKQFDLGDSFLKKNINAVSLRAEGDGELNIEYLIPKSCGSERADLKSGAMKNIRLLPMIHSAESIGLKISSDGRFSLSGIRINYDIMK